MRFLSTKKNKRAEGDYPTKPKSCRNKNQADLNVLGRGPDVHETAEVLCYHGHTIIILCILVSYFVAHSRPGSMVYAVKQILCAHHSHSSTISYMLISVTPYCYRHGSKVQRTAKMLCSCTAVLGQQGQFGICRCISVHLNAQAHTHACKCTYAHLQKCCAAASPYQVFMVTDVDSRL